MATDNTTGPKSPRKPLTDAERDQIAQAAQAKESIASIAERFGCSHATIYNALAMRIKPPWKADRISKEQQAEIVRLAEAGTLVKELAERYGCTTSNIHAILYRAGTRAAHPLYKLTDDQKADACRLYQAGESIKSLMVRFNLAEASIRRHLEAGGVEIRPRVKKERKTPAHNCIHCGAALKATESHRRRCMTCVRASHAIHEANRRKRLDDVGACLDCGGVRDRNFGSAMH